MLNRKPKIKYLSLSIFDEKVPLSKKEIKSLKRVLSKFMVDYNISWVEAYNCDIKITAPSPFK